MTEVTEIVDPVEEMLKKTGCIELHYKVQVRNLVKKVCSHRFQNHFIFVI